MTDIPDAPVTDLDPRRIGAILARLPAVAASLRHNSLEMALYYVWEDPAEPEIEFVRDMLTEPLDVLLDRWYGGRLHASRLAAGTMDAIIAELRPPTPAS